MNRAVFKTSARTFLIVIAAIMGVVAGPAITGVATLVGIPGAAILAGIPGPTVSAAALPVHGSFTTALSVTLADPHTTAWRNELELQLNEAVGPVDLLATLRLTHDGSATGDNVRAELSEAALIWYGDEWRVNAGRQVLNWGTALKLNPTNVVNPIDISDPEMGLLPVQLVAVTHYPGPDWEVSAVWIPEFQPVVANIPGPGGGIIPVPRPDPTWENSEWAARALYRGRGFDLSLIGFYGWDGLPSVKLTPQGPKPSFERVTTLGVGYASSIGAAGLWAEGSYSMYPEADDRDPSTEVVVGGDYSLANGIKLLGQIRWSNSGIGGGAGGGGAGGGVGAGGETEQTQLMAAISGEWAIIHSWQVGAMVDFSSQTWSLQPQVEFSLADAVALTVYASVSEASSSGPLALEVADHIGVRLAAQF